MKKIKIDKTSLNGWAISTEVFEWIKDNIPFGSNILELGSGSGTKELAKLYNMYSIENNPAFVGLYKSDYCYAELKQYDGYIWYDIPTVKEFLKDKDYQLILVDAPEGRYGREGFIFNLDLFNLSCPVIIDDSNRKQERKIADTLFEMFEFSDYIELNKNPEKGAVVLL